MPNSDGSFTDKDLVLYAVKGAIMWQLTRYGVDRLLSYGRKLKYRDQSN